MLSLNPQCPILTPDDPAVENLLKALGIKARMIKSVGIMVDNEIISANYIAYAEVPGKNIGDPPSFDPDKTESRSVLYARLSRTRYDMTELNAMYAAGTLEAFVKESQQSVLNFKEIATNMGSLLGIHVPFTHLRFQLDVGSIPFIHVTYEAKVQTTTTHLQFTPIA